MYWFVLAVHFVVVVAVVSSQFSQQRTQNIHFGRPLNTSTEAKKQIIHKVACVLVWECVHHASPQYRVVATNQINKIAFYVCICAQQMHTKWMCVCVCAGGNGGEERQRRRRRASDAHSQTMWRKNRREREIPVHGAHKDNKNDKQQERQQMKRN